jgi:RNA polymerase sigma-70 factor (ECF subfamily)
VSENHDQRFARILSEMGPALARLASGYEANATEREDLLQEIAIAIWRALPRFRGECSERTFVYRIAHNRGLTHRARRRSPAGQIGDVPDVPDPRPGPDARLAANRRQEQLAAAIRQLDTSHRSVVLLTLEGLSNREVADVIGISEGNVAVRLTRARARLRELLTGAGA